MQLANRVIHLESLIMQGSERTSEKEGDLAGYEAQTHTQWPTVTATHSKDRTQPVYDSQSLQYQQSYAIDLDSGLSLGALQLQTA